MAGADQRVAGVDGCRGGWVVATVPQRGRGPIGIRVVADLGDVVAEVETGHLAAVAIDIPIGLPAHEPRAADVLARSRLGPRRSSVFPAPCRAVLGADDYAEACARSRAVCGKAVSKQLFNILPKIAEIDAILTPSLQERIVEMCPELSFAVLTGRPMTHRKTTSAGRRERVAALESVFAGVAAQTDRPPAGAQRDDVVDALVGAWTAQRVAEGVHMALGGAYDDTGLRMEVSA